MKPVIDKEAVCWNRVDDETLLLNLETGFYYTLDEIGGRVWEMLLEGLELQAIAERIAAEYDAAVEIVRADVKQLLEELGKEGMLAFE